MAEYKTFQKKRRDSPKKTIRYSAPLLLSAIVPIGMKHELLRTVKFTKEIFKWSVLGNGKRFWGRSNSKRELMYRGFTH